MLKKRLVAGIMTLAMTLGMCFGGAVTARADDNPTVDQPDSSGDEGSGDTNTENKITADNLKIVKKLEMSTHATIPSNGFTFTFKFTPYKVTEDTTIEAVKDTPSISDKTVTYSSVNQGTEVPGSDFLKYKVLEVGNIFDGVAFNHAGIYQYKVTEVRPETTDSTTMNNVVYSNEEYLLKVVVENDDSAAGGVKIDQVIVKKEGAAGKTDKLEFENEYISKGSFKIKKTVTGNLADKTKKFDFTLQFIQAPIISTETSMNYDGTITRKAGSGTPQTETVTCDENGKLNFKLADGDTLEFTNIPVGTRYTVSENPDGYAPGATKKPIGAGETGNTAGGYVDGQNGEKLWQVSNVLVGEGGSSANYVAFTNGKNDTVPGGILTNNLPFILMIAAAILGLAAYVVVKSRKAKH